MTAIEKKHYKILLISLYNHEAFGLRLLHSLLYQSGYDVKMLFIKKCTSKVLLNQELKLKNFFNKRIDNITDAEYDILENFIAEYKPKIIGFSLVSSNFTLYKKIYSRIRKLGNFKIVLGGWHVSLNPEECINYSDMLCIGEGEEAFQELVDSLFYNKSPKHIKNIWVREEKKITKNPVRPLNTKLDCSAVPIFNEGVSYYIADNKIAQENPYMQNMRYGTIIGRGCPYKCTYCSNNFMSEKVYSESWSKPRFRPVDNVLAELREVKKRLPKVNRINFYDDVFLPPKEWAMEFFKHYRKDIRLPFYCMFYPGIGTEDMVKLLKDSMLSGVWLGIQSGSERVRKEIFKRYYSNSIIKKQARLFHKYGVDVRYDIILDNPFEIFDESIESIKLLLELPEPFSVNLFSLKFFPNTEITNMAFEAGIICKENLDNHRIDNYDNYCIRNANTNVNVNSNFINSLATYVSLLAMKSQAQTNKEKIIKIIDKYRQTKDVKPIKKILANVMRGTTGSEQRPCCN